MTGDSILYLLPELLLIAAASGIYVLATFFPARGLWSWAAVAGVLAAGTLLAIQERDLPLAGGPLAPDALALYGRWLALAVGLLFALLAARAGPDVPEAEFAGTLLMIVAGTMLVAAAGDLVLLFLGLELISIPTYVLLYVARRSPASQEAAAKYFFLSVLSSAVLLYGLSFLYGVGGSTDLDAIRAAFAARAAEGTLGPLAALALVLVFAGLAFRVAAAPFHFYAPDVYQGTTHGNAGLLSVVPKVAGFVALVRLTMLAMPGLEELGWRAALILAMLTMTVGNVLALWQDNVRRLMAYSSIAHAGYLLIGLAVGFATAGDARPVAVGGVAALLFYLAVYAVATTGTFAALAWLGRDGQQLDTVDELAGLGRTRPVAGLALAAFMFSLAGVPPLAGFWGKLQLFLSALSVDSAGPDVTPVQGWFIALAVVGVVNAAIAAAYYLRIVGVMYFRPADGEAPPAEGGAGAFAAMLLCAAGTLLLGVLPGPVLREATLAGSVIHEEAHALGVEHHGHDATSRSRESLAASTGLWNVADQPAHRAWGDLRGRFMFDGRRPELTVIDLRAQRDARALSIEEVPDESLVVTEDGGLANVLIYLRSPGAPIHPDYERLRLEPVTMDFHGLRLAPRIALVRVGQSLVFGNRDELAHSGNVQSLGDRGISPNLLTTERQFARSHNVSLLVGCNIHLWERGYVAVRDNPYMAVTAEDGTFEIENLPAGEWEFQAWHERAGYLAAQPEWVKGRFTVEITDGEVTDLGEVRAPAELFQDDR